MKISKEILKIAVMGGLLIVVQAFAFSEPPVAPPGGNVPAPLNVGNIGQTKTVGLILNWGLDGATGGAPNGLAVAQGNVGIGTVTPAQKLDVVGGQIHATGDICTDAGGGRCLSSVGSDSPFGGIYQTKGSCKNLGPNGCGYPNPLTGTCSCPAGYTAYLFATLCGGFPGNTNMIQCVK